MSELAINPDDNQAPEPPTHLSLTVMVERWQYARMRSFLGKHSDHGPAADPGDLVVELAYGTAIAKEVTESRWCVVAELLRAGQSNPGRRSVPHST